MNIAHLCTLDHGGAAAAALRLHDGLTALGAHSTVLALTAEQRHRGVLQVPLRHAPPGQTPWRTVTERWNALVSRCKNRPKGMELFSGPRADTDLASCPALAGADVINLHWTPGLVDIPSLPRLAEGKVVVWTLHDMNPFTGGCHFSGGCERFKQGCGACPQLGSGDPADISAAFLAEKARAYARTDFSVVSPSHWLAGQARAASCLGGRDVRVIPYGLDTKAFAPVDPGPARASLGLEADDFVILYGADYAAKRKGGEEASRLLAGLPAIVKGRRVVLAAFGAPQPGLGGEGVHHKDLGYLRGEEALTKAYSMADVLLMPTLEDNLPNTVLEAMSCATPAVGFATGGMPDMVEHGVNGWLAPTGDVDGLRRCLEQAVECSAEAGRAARRSVEERFGLLRQAWAYLDVYALGIASLRAAKLGPQARKGKPFKESANAHKWLDGLSGLEIGPAAHNPFGLNTRNVGLNHHGYHEEQLRLAGHISPLHVEAEADALPLPSESEDFVLSSHVVEHCPDFVRALLEWYRVLKPGGVLYLTTPKRDAAPSDRGKPLTSWEHVAGDFDNRQTQEKETEAGAFGYCHYHVFSPRTMRAFIRQVFGERLALVDSLESDDKVGNGFTLVYRKASSLHEDFPWTIGAGAWTRELALRPQDLWERIDFAVKSAWAVPAAAPVQAPQTKGSSPAPDDSIDRRAEAVLQDRQAGPTSPMPGRALLALAAFAATDPGMAARQQAGVRTLESLAPFGIEFVIPCLEHETQSIREAFPGVRVEPLLKSRADERLGVSGRPKPFMDEYFDAACTLALDSGMEWFGFANSDLLFTPQLADLFGQAMSRGDETVIVSRTELSALDASGRPVPGRLEFAGYDAFFCRTDWWRANRRRFSPYIIGERAWDNAYASIMLTHSRAVLSWRPGLLWHPEHERRWNLEDTAYGDWNMALYSGRDQDYARRFEAFVEDVLASGADPLPQGDALDALLARNFRDAPPTPGRDGRFVNVVMVTYNRKAFTRQAIGSILRTADRPYRLTVVDNGSDDGTPEYLKELARKGLVHNLVLNPENLGVARAANQGWLAEPGAAFMLKYDNDIVMRRAGWLSEMVRTSDALGGLGALAYNFEPRSYPLVEDGGVRVRLKLRGNLGGACLLIPARTHQALGFWTEQFGLYGEEDADYCRRVVNAGWFLAYMEDEDAGIHLPGGKAAVIDKTTYDARNGVEEIQESAYRAFKDEQRRKSVGVRDSLFAAYESGDSPLFHDTGMRGRMPLFRPARRTAAALPAPGDAARACPLERPLRVMHVAPDEAEHPCLTLRVSGPNRILADKGLIEWRLQAFTGDTKVLYWDRQAEPAADVYTMARGVPHSLGRALIDFAEAHGAVVLFEIDDYLLELPQGHPETARYLAMRPELEDLMARSCGVIVPVRALADRLRAVNPSIWVFPNFPDPKLFPTPVHPAKGPGEPLVIGVTGTSSHALDAAPLLGAFKALLKVLKGRAVLEFWGFTPAGLEGHPQIRQGRTFTNDYAEYARALCRSVFDMALVPLADNAFNRCKSPVKHLEYALAGIPAVYSAVGPYEAVEHGVTGLLASNTPDSWVENAVRLASDPDLRKAIALQARQRALSAHGLEENAPRLLDIYREAVKRRRGEAADFGREPVASVIIPVWNQWEHTRNCLRHLDAATDVPHERIIVDNASTDETKARLPNVAPHAVLLRNPANLGFVAACNQGAKLSRGKYIVFLNNDAMPRPSWLKALVDAAEADPTVGAVGAKLIYPDGALQEAGGVVFSDGSALNFGRGGDPADPRFNAPCEADYCSGACLLVRREAFERVGGLDMRYSPGYYEETDLCFALRKAGYKVLYEPRAEVVHVGSVSAGLDPESGMRRHLAVNRTTFLDKWSAELSRHEPPQARDAILTQSRDRLGARHREPPPAVDENTPVHVGADGLKVLMLSDYTPRFDKSSSNLRVHWLARLFTDGGARLEYLYFARDPDDARYAAMFPQATFSFMTLDPAAYAEAVVKSSPDVLWITNLWTTPWLAAASEIAHRVREKAPNVAIVMDTMDFHTKKYRRKHETSRDPQDLKKAQVFLRLERVAYKLAHAVAVVSEAERGSILAEIPESAPVSVLSNVERLSPSTAPFGERKGMAFVGNFEVNHNFDAALHFRDAILPHLEKLLPEARLSLIGPGSLEAQARLAHPAIDGRGRVDDLAAELSRYRLFACPLTYGAGMKGKVFSAALAGLPMVVTPLSLEGIGFEPGRDCLAAVDPAGFAEACARLYGDEALWGALAANALSFMAKQFSPRRFSLRLRDFLSSFPAAKPDGPRKKEDPVGSHANLAQYYKSKGNMEKYRRYAAQAATQADPSPAPEAAIRSAPQAPAGPSPAEQGLMLYNAGRDAGVLALAEAHPKDQALASMASAILLRQGELTPESPCLEALEDEERRAKLNTAALLPALNAPLEREPRVHMIILTHNRAKEIPQAFKALAATDYRNYTVYVADNGSQDGSFEAASKALALFPPHVQTHVERLPTNIGRPAGHNWLLTAHDHSRAEFIAIGDDDLTNVPRDWLTKMVATAKLFPGCAAVGGKALNPGRPKVIHGGVRRFMEFEPTNLKISNERQELDIGQYDAVDLTDHVIACLQIYDKAALDKLGLFDIRFSPCQLVDIEHHLRLRLNGRLIVFNGLIEFEHLRAMGRKAGSDRAAIGNSLGNVVKLLHKYDHEDVKRMIARSREERARWLATGVATVSETL